jgi:hypothetical protein
MSLSSGGHPQSRPSIRNFFGGDTTGQDLALFLEGNSQQRCDLLRVAQYSRVEREDFHRQMRRIQSLFSISPWRTCLSPPSGGRHDSSWGTCSDAVDQQHALVQRASQCCVGPPSSAMDRPAQCHRKCAHCPYEGPLHRAHSSRGRLLPKTGLSCNLHLP